MNEAILKKLVDRALSREVTFPEILASLAKEGVESYQVDFLRNEYRWYATTGASLVMPVAMGHDGVAAEFSAAALDGINKRVQAGLAGYPEFVKEGTAAGCASYNVYIIGGKVRYFGRDCDEHVQHFPIPQP